MNRVELVAAVVEKADVTKRDAEAAVKAVFDTIAEALERGDRVQYLGFGTFDVLERAEREVRNPRTGEKMKVGATRKPRFKPGKALKDRLQ